MKMVYNTGYIAHILSNDTASYIALLYSIFWVLYSNGMIWQIWEL